jgi:hypothetical protein
MYLVKFDYLLKHDKVTNKYGITLQFKAVEMLARTL